MNIVLAFTHTRRSVVPLAYRRAFRALGHHVISIGPFDDSVAFGARECLPDVPLPARTPPHYDWSEGLMPPQFAKPDVFMLMTAGDDLRVTGVPVPWVHWSADGVDLEWSDARCKYSAVEPCDGATVLPPAFEYHAARPTWPNVRAYDLVQLATATPERMQCWCDVLGAAPDLHCVFGDIWGPLYPTAHQHALATWIDGTTPSARLFEAMAMGCVVIADKAAVPASLFTANDHFIACDGVPDAAFLIAVARRLRKVGDGGMAKRAYAAVTAKHSYMHRARQIVMDVRAVR